VQEAAPALRVAATLAVSVISLTPPSAVDAVPVHAITSAPGMVDLTVTEIAYTNLPENAVPAKGFT